MDFQALAAQRYSLRKYSDRPVEDEKLQLILQAAQSAPTAHNLQPQRIFVLRSAPGRVRATVRTTARSTPRSARCR